MSFKRRVTNGDLRELVYSALSPIHGTGLFAKRIISKGEYIGTYHGPVAKRDGTYVLWVYDKGDAANAIGRSGRNLLRYLNHAQRGNAEFEGFDLYALKKIQADQEITFNYEGG
ncbi:MAG: SET domain-containing protein [Gammaproteobacteria bacterium]|nr:SET domain-containing protein [Gammaproteobacteria bacterium]